MAILAEMFAAREQNTLGISSADLCRNVPGAVYCSTLDKVADQLRQVARPGDLILTVGAGDIYRAGEKLLAGVWAMGISEIRTAAPAEGRAAVELETFALLDRLRIPYAWVAHETADTIADCDVVSEALGISICKNLFLCNRQKTEF